LASAVLLVLLVLVPGEKLDKNQITNILLQPTFTISIVSNNPLKKVADCLRSFVKLQVEAKCQMKEGRDALCQIHVKEDALLLHPQLKLITTARIKEEMKH
jgi:hypothetical protein